MARALGLKLVPDDNQMRSGTNPRNATARQGGAKGQGKDEHNAGLAAREIAVDLLAAVLTRQESLDEALAASFAKPAAKKLPARDRAYARLIAASALRTHAALERVISEYMKKPLPRRNWRVHLILLSAATQLLVLKTPAHAAISLAVDQVRSKPFNARLDKLVNAVLRKVATDGAALFQTLDITRMAIPDWLYENWQKAYGEETARKIASAALSEAALDVTVKTDPATWAQKLGGVELSTGSVRLEAGGRIEDLSGFDEGAWWIQDAAASLPAKMFGDVAGKSVVDLCAAPGGKTAQLATAGATVSAVDVSEKRLEKVKANLARLALNADLVAGDARDWRPAQNFDCVLVDAPCTATGTIRRHPDILHLKRDTDVETLVPLQAQLLDAAYAITKPGGMLVYCSCSLEPAEGERQISDFLERTPGAVLSPLTPGEAGIEAEWITPEGYLRTLPHFTVRPAGGGQELPGLDGFFAARIIRPQ